MRKLAAITILVSFATAAFAGPTPPNLANDTYGVAQGGTVNGIPTPNDDNDGTPDINDAINQLLVTSYANNVDVDHLQVANDEVWKDMTGTIALIGLTAGNSNTIGVYTGIGTGAGQTPILGPYSGFGFVGDGSLTNPYPAASTGLSSGTLFGWYLRTDDGSGPVDYFSESALNPLFDHMLTYDLSELSGESIYVQYGSGPNAIVSEWTLNSPYLICWEDLPWDPCEQLLGDEDYDDMIYLVDRVVPIPAPGALLLGCLGAGIVAWRRRFA